MPECTLAHTQTHTHSIGCAPVCGSSSSGNSRQGSSRLRPVHWWARGHVCGKGSVFFKPHLLLSLLLALSTPSPFSSSLCCTAVAADDTFLSAPPLLSLFPSVTCCKHASLPPPSLHPRHALLSPPLFFLSFSSALLTVSLVLLFRICLLQEPNRF